MSGPKVVRIVTREEMESIKASHVFRLESLVNEIKVYADKHKIFNDDQIKEIESRLESYRNLDASEYRKIETEIPSQVEFLETEKERLEEIVKKNTLSRRDKSRHLIASIKSLKAMYDKRSMSLPESIVNIERNSHLLWLSSEEVERIEFAISEAFSALNREKTLDTESEELSQRLNQGQETINFSEWLMKADLVKLTASQQRLEAIIAGLDAQDITADSKQRFIDRSNHLFTEESSQQLDMKIDSLSIEISSFIKESRVRSQKLREYNNLLRDLKRIEINKTEFEGLTLKSRDTVSVMDIDESVFKLTKFFEAKVEQRASCDKREALLSAFENLGYEISEEMETAFVKNGRLIVNKNAGSQYGIELGSPSNLQRIQLRVVSNQENSSVNTTEDDIAAEESWCEDFNKIKADFSTQGMFFEIDRHLKPGEAEMKKVDFESDRWKRSAGKPKDNRQRKID